VSKKKLVEHNALLQAVEMGMSKNAIMEKFGIKTLAELKVAYFDAMVALDKIKNVNKGRRAGTVDNKVRINSRGSLVIPKKLVDALELDEGDTFEVAKNDTGLILNKVKKRSKTILRKRSSGSAENNKIKKTRLLN
jgi:AbrB family looped-hinge helix DNA binding protein